MTTFYEGNPFEIDVHTLNLEKQKKINVVSLFSGCGGMDLGFLGGFEYLNKEYSFNPFNIIFANDIFEAAMKVYEHNFKHKGVNESIAEIDLNKIPKAEVVIGGFPCQDFSLAGKRKGLTSERGRLYEHMIRVIKHCDAKMFVAENVDGIRTNKADKSLDISALDTILSDFEKSGYEVQYKVLNAADFGVPQIRKRVIIFGVRKDIYEAIYYPKPTHSEFETHGRPWITSKEAIDDIWDKIDDPNVLNHTSKDYSKAKFYPGRKMQGNNRIPKHRPAGTIRAEHHGNIEAHYNTLLPDENDMRGWRRLSIRECARIQSFPDDFNFVVSPSSAYKMIGNAVPPVMAWHIARAAYYTLSISKKDHQLEFQLEGSK
ncbi:DNA cytosine methyltransferase [Bacillus haynesii]|uniref:DNA cytosine methyltransferase n=1 Tax=Bacillus TaxID=1386 RepID=UPI00227E6E8F|nr:MULTISPECIES: DNA cytosine methyltransferase [Bacillus]MCY7858141.1 DNA cytosine methyltransferase [Bacillus sonorensis]MCY8268727.1 DNA cytosine methyltransferase [Bacillus haynesii]MCY8354919.1 DNA cytosine methyltransferase [Bacillus haynesii]MCY8553925.1 DNA cytosine methyltransferase [Bacillus haynesii]MCZ0068073.1 DNA cytosine methyltransferase [Bacillus sonorensis]